MDQATKKDTRTFRLGDWRAEPQANCLRLGDREERIETRVMDLLVYLADHAGEVVSREQLEGAIWGDAIVGYEALTNAIAKLRKVFDDDAKAPRYIETISKKGYRLIAPVSPDTATEGAQSTTRPRTTTNLRASPVLIGAGLVAAITVLAVLFWLPSSDRKSDRLHRPDGSRPAIAVLPFSNLGRTGDGDYLSNGVTADITTELSKLSGLFVVSTGATDSDSNSRNLTRYAGKLGVRYVVQGSVRRGGDRLRVNVTLVDAASNAVLWSENYDSKPSDLFELQDSIVRKIVDTLQVQLTEAERQRAARRYTISIEAYDDFLRGQSLYARHTREDNLQAREYYQRALLRDDRFARAYSAMALTYAAEHRYGWTQSQSGLLDEALNNSRKAIEIDKDLPQAHWVQAYIQVFRRDYKQASRSAERAIELNPNFADSYLSLAVCRIHDEHPEQALELVRKAMLLNPEYPAAYASVLGQAHFYLRQYEQALSPLRDAINRNPNLVAPQVFLIVALGKSNQMEEARWAAEKLKLQAPDFHVGNVGKLLAIDDTRTVSELQKDLRQAGLD